MVSMKSVHSFLKKQAYFQLGQGWGWDGYKSRFSVLIPKEIEFGLWL